MPKKRTGINLSPLNAIENQIYIVGVGQAVPIGTCEALSENYYTSVAFYFDWILENIRSISYDPNTRILRVNGTGNNDHFGFVAKVFNHELNVNGKAYTFPSDKVDVIVFNGGAGHDTATATGGYGRDWARMYPHKLVLSGWNYRVKLNQI